MILAACERATRSPVSMSRRHPSRPSRVPLVPVINAFIASRVWRLLSENCGADLSVHRVKSASSAREHAGHVIELDGTSHINFVYHIHKMINGDRPARLKDRPRRPGYKVSLTLTALLYM